VLGYFERLGKAVTVDGGTSIEDVRKQIAQKVKSPGTS